MGNCLKNQSTAKYYATDDDEVEDWDCSPAREGGDFPAEEIGGGKPTTEVKIKITKKQLEALLGKVDVRDLRVEQVMAQLMSHSDRFQSQTHQRSWSWRPALQSIPEVN